MSERSCFYCGSIQNMAVGEAYEVGKSVEQERIIKLLSDAQKCVSDDDCHCRDCCNCSIIALIKGEK